MDLLRPGMVLRDRYRIELLLHRGTWGGVYKAKDARFPGRWWTIKELIIPRAEAEPRIARRFTEMLKQISAFQHPALLKIIDYFPQQDRLYTVSEFIEGRSLAEIAGETGGTFPESQVILLALRLTDLARYLLERRKLLRIVPDLKPTNLLITGRGEVKLVDVGLARVLDAEGVDPARGVTMGYGAPELYQGGTVDERSGIYSIGVVMHEMLTRHSPTDTPFILPPVAELNPLASKGVSILVARAVAADPAARFGSFARFESELRQCLRNTPR